MKILLHLFPFRHNIIMRPHPRGFGGNKMLEFERNKDRNIKILFLVTEIILHHNPLGLLKKRTPLWRLKGKSAGFFLFYK